MTKNHQERIGEFFIGLQVLLAGFFPILVNQGVKLLSPLNFLAYVTLISVPFFLVTTLQRKELKQLFQRETFPYLLGVTLFIVVIPHTLLFWGTQFTSGINTALLTQSHIVFAALIMAFLGESLRGLRLVSICLILLGSLIVLFNGSLSLNTGDVVIFLFPLSFVVGNILGKKVLKKVSWSVIMLFRMSVGGLFILSLAAGMEGLQLPPKELWLSILVIGLLINGLSKIFWYKGLERLDISKATALLVTHPVLSVIYAVWFFDETASLYQLLGLSVMLLGVFFILRTPSRQYNLPVYETQ